MTVPVNPGWYETSLRRTERWWDGQHWHDRYRSPALEGTFYELRTAGQKQLITSAIVLGAIFLVGVILMALGWMMTPIPALVGGSAGGIVTLLLLHRRNLRRMQTPAGASAPVPPHPGATIEAGTASGE